MSQRGEEEPLYGRISGRLLAQIHAGKFGAGEQLPSEAQLMRQFGVSRNTVRAAVQQLVDSGL
jgi:GntR family transcriptional regulator